MRAFFGLFVVCFLPQFVLGQMNFSIDGQGPTSIFGGGPVSEGDLLTPAAVIPPPPVVTTPAALLGIAPTGPGTPLFRELDAMSFGGDCVIVPFQPMDTILRVRWSIDEFAVGTAAIVAGSGATGTMEASADIFETAFVGGAPPSTALFADGSFDLNLVEPNPPTPTIPDIGDNLDAMELDEVPQFPAYFSLDAAYPDPLEPAAAPPVNFGTAPAQPGGFAGADILVTLAPGILPTVYASAADLGLTAGQDDVDALALFDMDRDAFYEPLDGDVILYSVRRGSLAIGAIDPVTGLAIEEGDILTPFDTGPAIVPSIYIPAEDLGLATVRSSTAMMFGDDLDALDLLMDIPEPASGTMLLAVMFALAIRRRPRHKAA